MKKNKTAADAVNAENAAVLKNGSARDRVRLFVTLGTTGILCMGQLVLSSLVIRYAGSVIGWVGGKAAPGEELVSTLSAVFGQLRDAVLSQPYALPLVLWGVTFLLGWLPGKLRLPKWAKRVSGILCVLLLLAGLFLTLALTRVNGVRLADVLASLAHLAAGGLFERL